MKRASRLAIAARIALVVPPRRMDAFNKVLVKKLKTFQKAVARFDTELEKVLDGAIFYEVYDDDPVPFGHLLAEGLEQVIGELTRLAAEWMKARTLPIEEMTKDSLSHHYFAKQYIEVLEAAVENLKGGKNWFASDKLTYFAKAVDTLTFGPDAKDSIEYYRDGDAADQAELKIVLDQQQLKGLRDEVLATMEAALERVQALRDPTYDGFASKFPSSTQKIETLYHASANAVTLYRTGFSTETPEKGGLGGSQRTRSGVRATSFTFDLRVALAVARGLKEVASIAKGHIKTRDIKDWARKEGILDAVYRQYRSGTAPDKEPDDTPNGAFWFYKAYKMVRDFRLAHYDPVFFGVRIDDFKGINPQHVGVLVAEVNTQHPDVTFVGGREREVRAPADAVVRIVKLLK